MMMSLLLAVLAFAQPTFKWQCPREVRVEDDRLVAIATGASRGEVFYAEGAFDATPYLGHVVRFSIDCSARDVQPPKFPWVGIKFASRYFDDNSGTWRGTMAKQGCYGTFDKEHLTFDEVFRGVATTNARLFVGLQMSTGRVEFDLRSLRVEIVDGDWPETNANLHCAYTDSVRKAPRRRGAMMPPFPDEKCVADFAALGGNLLRYQMHSLAPVPQFWWSERDQISFFHASLDRQIDYLDKTLLALAGKYGLSVVIDIHDPPGFREHSDNDMPLYRNPVLAAELVETWRRIAVRFKGRKGVYGYDILNEPVATRPPAKDCDYWNLQRRVVEAIRSVDPETPVIVASAEWDVPRSFSYLSPIDASNVIYQVHMYEPHAYTHQLDASRAKLAYPGRSPDGLQTWDRAALVRFLEPVRAFERRHGAKIYVGEFSAAGWAKGSDLWIRDAISIFEEYGWDWSYHAWRESKIWSVEDEFGGIENGKPKFAPSTENARYRILCEALRKNKD